jgi:hypothetical protein
MNTSGQLLPAFTRIAARGIAANIAKLPERVLIRRPAMSQTQEQEKERASGGDI